MSPRRVDFWLGLIGLSVEARLDPTHRISGVVDDAMPDSSLLWLIASDGSRQILEKRRGHTVYVHPQAIRHAELAGMPGGVSQ
ncbi:hypothetical protein ACLKOZ_15230 [Arthrobacter sp. R4]|uniref:hypothetical protein n=1 Tax=Arthrobacter sp. R4 TaxID=644417 RepID=UPI003EDA2D7F